MHEVADNVKRIRQTIRDTALSVGADPDSILLLAAAKTQTSEAIVAAISAGVDAVGENRVQEMTEKLSQGAYSGVPLHFIGHLQSNKINKVVGVCDLIESVGSAETLTAIGKRAQTLNIIQDVLLEVNIGREQQKSGIAPEQTEELLHIASMTPSISVLGLMAIPPFGLSPSDNRRYFDEMFNLFVDIRAKKYDNVSVRLLSLGMSDSYVEAIKAGSNLVRIGSALFGQR